MTAKKPKWAEYNMDGVRDIVDAAFDEPRDGEVRLTPPEPRKFYRKPQIKVFTNVQIHNGTHEDYSEVVWRPNMLGLLLGREKVSLSSANLKFTLRNRGKDVYFVPVMAPQKAAP